MTTHHRSIEPLESRIAPAVVASLSHGVLSVLGDDQANEVTISETETQGSYIVTGLTDGPSTFTGVTSIKVDLGTDQHDEIAGGVGPFDTLRLVDAAEDVTLGALTVTGHDRVEVYIDSGIHISGRATFDQKGVEEFYVTTLGDSSDDTSFGSLSFSTGPGSLAGYLNGVQVFGDVMFRGSNHWSAANEQLNFYQSSIEGDILVNSTSEGSVTLEIYETAVAGLVRLNGTGEGGAFLRVIEGSVVQGPVSFNYGGIANSEVGISGATLLNGITYVSEGQDNQFIAYFAHVEGQIRVRLPELAASHVEVSDSVVDGVDVRGSNLGQSIQFGASTVNGPVYIQTAPTDAFYMQLQETNFLQGFRVNNTGSGENNIWVTNITGTGSFVGNFAGPLNYFDFQNFNWDGDFTAKSATGSDRVTLLGSSISGAVNLDLGGEANRVELIDSSIGSLRITTEEGADDFTFSGSTVIGTTVLGTGNGDDIVTIGDSTFDDFRFAAGEGNNQLTAGYGTEENGTATIFNGSLTYTGGTGNDIIFLGDELNGVQVLGNLAINAGNGGADQFYTYDSAVTGNVTLVQGAGTTGDFRLNNSSVGGNLIFNSQATEQATLDLWLSNVGGSVTAKSATSLIFALTEATIGGQLTYSGGNGYGLFALGGATIGGRTSIALGEGDSEILLGVTHFGADVAISGGTGPIIATWDSLTIDGSLNINASQTLGLKLTASGADVSGDVVISTAVSEIELNGYAIGGSLKYRGGFLSEPDLANSFILNQVQAQNLNIVTGDIRDQIYVFGSAILGNVTINTNGGEDEIYFEDSDLGDVRISSGADNDVVGIEALEADPTGTTIRSLVFAGGDGDEQVQYGLGPDSVINILGIARFNGGAGFNQSNTLGNGSNIIFNNFVLYPAV